MPEIPWKWFEAFHGWNYLYKFGRPSAMGLVQMDFKTVMKYVEFLPEAAGHELILAEQIITIDIEFVKSTQKDK